MSLRNKLRLHILKLTAVYAIFTAVTLFIVIFFINASIVVDTSSSAGAESKLHNSGDEGMVQVDARASANSTIQKSEVFPSLSGIPSGADSLSFSGDGQYCVYCFKGTLYVMDIKSDKIIKEIAEKSAISYAILMYDRNIVIYFTAGHAKSSDKAVSNGEITVNTYNIDTEQKTTHYSFKAGSGAAIKHADYSSTTGHVCFDVYNGNSDVIYYINMMKNLIKIPVGGPIESMALANSRQAVYYEKGNTLYYQSQLVKSLQKVKVRLLGCDLKDYVYVQSLSDKTCVYVVNGVGIVKKIRLNDAGFIKIYSNKTNIYLVYPDHILNLSSDPAKMIMYDKIYSFEGIIDNSIYLSDGNGDIIIKDSGN